MEGSIAIDVEGSNESATEDPSVGGSGEEELETSEVSAAARRRFRRGAVAGITCGDVFFVQTNPKRRSRRRLEARPWTPEKN